MEAECEVIFEKKAKKTTFLRALEDFNELEKKMVHSCEKLCYSDTWIAGIDESGRGPVLGPMVYSVAYCPRSYENQLKKYGFSDSKTLTPEKREHLMQALLTSKGLKENVGWFTCIISAREISQKMLQPNESYNLNAQAHNTTIQLLHEVFKICPNIKEIYVDTVGPSSSYQVKLQQLFPQANVTVSEKADSIYPIVSTASICAKVTRDKALAKVAVHGETWGSGYPSGNNSQHNTVILIHEDPKTCEWLRDSMDPIFGWPYEIVRYSWQTAKDLLEKDLQKKDNSKVHVEWYSKNEASMSQIQNYFKVLKTTQESIGFSIYGQNVELDDF
ncbi:hypothetical protein PCANB_001431 [Pneumocystis canis]|nr:hypothetical protein PCK1_001415 [Pneumocystis canis]KAG5439132.1 hypothetical protein PCANB_001431 [Pneumocystis canis]